MLKHYISYTDNVYYIERDGVIVFSVELQPNNQIKISTPKEVYSGPIDLIGFDPDSPIK